jgi:microcystin-dependent protein
MSFRGLGREPLFPSQKYELIVEMGSYFRDYYCPKASQRPTVGDTKFSVVNMDHMGWLKCDGRALSVATYNILFQAIGYQFGGSGNTFNLPDAQGRVPGAIGTSTGNNWNLGDVSGQETHTLTIAQMPAHTHGSADVTGNTNGNGITDLSGAHTHSGTTDGAGWAASDLGVSGLETTRAADNEGSHTHTFTTGQPSVLHHHQIFNTGGGQPHNNMQPTIFMGNMFIYSAKQSFTAGSYPYTTSYPATIGNILL